MGVRTAYIAFVGLALILPNPFAFDGDREPGAARAQEQRRPPRARTVESVGTHERKLLNAAQEAMVADDHEAALERLRELEAYERRNDYETALMHQLFGHAYSQVEDFASALASFEAAVATDALPAQAEVNLLYNLGQLYLAVERFDEAIRSLEAWIEKVENPSPRGYVLLAHAYVSKGDFEQALPPIEKAIERSPAPEENWLRLLLAVRIELDQLAEAAEVLEILVSRFSAKNYWIQLSAIYAGLERDRASLNAMEMAYRQGFLTEGKELVRMAELYLYNGIPYQAGVVLERGFGEKKVEESERNWQLLADSWISAKEFDRALPPLERAASISQEGDLSLRLGHVYLQSEDWTNAVAALRTALAKGGLDKPSSAQLLLGISLFNLGEVSEAKEAFHQAARHDATRKSAHEWLAHLDRAS